MILLQDAFAKLGCFMSSFVITRRVERTCAKHRLWHHLTLVPFWLKVVSLESDHKWGHMNTVVTQEGSVEELDEFPSALFISWVIIGASCFLLGLVCSACCRTRPTAAPHPGAPGRWEHLVKKALRFISRRRRASLALGAFQGNTLPGTQKGLGQHRPGRP